MLLQDSDTDVVDSTLFIPSEIIWHGSFVGSRCRGYKNAYLIALMETWLKDQDLQSDLEINDFGEPLRLDRDPIVTWWWAMSVQYINKN